MSNCTSIKFFCFYTIKVNAVILRCIVQPTLFTVTAYFRLFKINNNVVHINCIYRFVNIQHTFLFLDILLCIRNKIDIVNEFLINQYHFFRQTTLQFILKSDWLHNWIGYNMIKFDLIILSCIMHPVPYPLYHCQLL